MRRTTGRRASAISTGRQPPTAPATTIEEFATVDQYALQADAFAMAISQGSTGRVATL